MYLRARPLEGSASGQPSCLSNSVQDNNKKINKKMNLFGSQTRLYMQMCGWLQRAIVCLVLCVWLLTSTLNHLSSLFYFPSRVYEHVRLYAELPAALPRCLCLCLTVSDIFRRTLRESVWLVSIRVVCLLVLLGSQTSF